MKVPDIALDVARHATRGAKARALQKIFRRKWYNIFMLTLGIDEVGRGAWAGPLAVGAVVFDSARVPVGLADSKQLTKHQRDKLSLEIKKSAVAIGVAWVDAPTIDRVGLSKALRSAARQAFEQIPPEIRAELNQIIIDGTVRLIEDPRVTTMIKADSKIAAVSAAAIVAKVFRDTYMAQLDQIFLGYDFAHHVGYGTACHQEKLCQCGAIDGVHRWSFAPIRKFCHPELAEESRRNCHPGESLVLNSFQDVSGSSVSSSSSDLIRGSIDSRVEHENDKPGLLNDNQKNFRETRGRTSRSLGYTAETVATEFLKQNGHQIIAQNWKTKFCEIDIISEHQKTLYFTEVKYRENVHHGDGLAAITPKKLRQMRFAAELYLLQNAGLTQDFDVKIAAIALSENPPQVDDFIENITT